ncbi:MAG: DoxX family membrane protein [Ignavibacteria bacterium]|jgi:uncharacterized membrane protein YphA (DoxX/SURF4 family)|nr:DoxX family membrane protein [Ignavibacteria bacterium]
MNIPHNQYINLIIRIVVAGVFIFTGISKIIEPTLFAKDIANYDMLWSLLINLMAIILPWLELITGILFLFGIQPKPNAILIAAMLLLFNIAVGVAWARGLDIHCGCYAAVAEEAVGIGKLAENFALLAGVAFVFFFNDNRISFSNAC